MQDGENGTQGGLRNRGSKTLAQLGTDSNPMLPI